MIEICIASFNSSILKNSNAIIDPNCKYLVVNQYDDEEGGLVSLADFPMTVNIRVFNVPEQGLSKSRNFAITHAVGDILIFADDDVIYSPDLISILQSAYEKENVCFVTFNNQDETGPKLESKMHNYLSVLKIPSWCISVRRDALDGDQFLFSEDFGIGAEYNCGEENIFLANLVKQKNGLHLDSELVMHQGLSTGFLFNSSLAKSKGAMCKKIFGYKGWFFLLAFCFKKISQIGLLNFPCFFLTAQKSFWNYNE